MDEETGDKVVYWITQFWSFFGVVAGVYLGGEAAKRVAASLGYAKLPEDKQPLLFRVWSSTMPWHPFLVGSLCGLVPDLPAADWVPEAWPARMLWFGIAGAVSGQLYEAVKKTWQAAPGIVRALLVRRLGISIPPEPAPATAPAKDPAPSIERPLDSDSTGASKDSDEA